MNRRKLVIVGNFSVTHIGHHFSVAADHLNVHPILIDLTKAASKIRLINSLIYRLFDKRRPYMARFGDTVLDTFKRNSASHVLVTGLAPIGKRTLCRLKDNGAIVLNYLTDDPFNPAHLSRWFLEALPYYDCVFSPRKSNMNELRLAGCKEVQYLPFGYAPEIHYPCESGAQTSLKEKNDVLFIGGADSDRVPYMEAVLKAGFKLKLGGGYWNRIRSLRGCCIGVLNSEEMRRAVWNSKVVVCLVRRANRDGNCMRTFEVPAMKGCMVAEDTLEHRDIFGAEGHNVMYFTSPSDLVRQIRHLLNNPNQRTLLAQNAYQIVMNNSNTYQDRLAEIFRISSFVMEKF